MRRTAKSQPPPPPPAEEIKVPPFTQATQSGGGEGERDAKDAAAAALQPHSRNTPSSAYRA